VISHIVLFRPKPTLSQADRNALIDALQHAVSGIPSIKRVSLGKRILLDRSGYEKEMAEHYEYSAIIDFETEKDLRAYLDHPAHAHLGKLLFSSAEAVLAYDFSAIDPADLV
jgi:hypothetical protein